MGMGMEIGVRPERVAEYRPLHADPWPEIDAALKEANMHDYSIFLNVPENLLFGVWDYRGTNYEGRHEAPWGEGRDGALAHADRSLPIAAGLREARRMVELHGLRLPSRLSEKVFR
jgi:hypothetical protein